MVREEDVVVFNYMNLFIGVIDLWIDCIMFDKYYVEFLIIVFELSVYFG